MTPARGDELADTHAERVAAGGAPAVDGLLVEGRVELIEPATVLTEGSPADAHGAGAGPVEAHDHSQRRALARPVGAEEPR